MCRRMDTAVKNLVFAEKIELLGCYFLDLGNKIALFKDFLMCFQNFGTCRCICLVGETCHLSAILLDIYLMPCSRDG